MYSLTQSLQRTQLCWTFVSIFSFVACVTPDDDDDGPKSVRDRVVAASYGFQQVDSDGNSGFFAETNFYKAFHSSDWEVHDPFTDATKYYLTANFISHSYAYKETQQAISMSKVSAQQVFIMLGKDPELSTRLEKGRQDWGAYKVTLMPATLVSKDGLELTYEVFHIKPGLLSGDELLLEIAYCNPD